MSRLDGVSPYRNGRPLLHFPLLTRNFQHRFFSVLPVMTASDRGLTNITFSHGSISEITDDFGQFDYILCHGVFSWVAVEVRDSILRTCQRNLTPNGIAFISYNAYPGNRLREMIREMMR